MVFTIDGFSSFFATPSLSAPSADTAKIAPEIKMMMTKKNEKPNLILLESFMSIYILVKKFQRIKKGAKRK